MCKNAKNNEKKSFLSQKTKKKHTHTLYEQSGYMYIRLIACAKRKSFFPICFFLLVNLFLDIRKNNDYWLCCFMEMQRSARCQSFSFFKGIPPHYVAIKTSNEALTFCNHSFVYAGRTDEKNPPCS